MALPAGVPPSIPPTTEPPPQTESEPPSQPEGPQKTTAIPKCAFCGGGPDGEPPSDVLTRAQEVRKERPLSERQLARMALEAGRLQQRRRGGILGPLLGPLSEKVGLAGVWVHRECAIWSPEVYFHDSGHLKNVAAAVRRGRLLRCVFCQRGGPTMGCFIERCPKSYHLACARADDCFFNHEDYLITCHDHAPRPPRRTRPGPGLPRPPQKRPRPWPLPIAEPQPETPPPGRPGKRARRAAAVAADQRISATARQDEEREAARGGDLAADEAEFLKRERRRLQRDLAQIAPLRLGGSEGGDASAVGTPPGWESVAGLRNVVDCLKEMVVFPLLYPEAFARLGGGPPRGVLLHGHPGTGKTLVARALAGACSRGPHQVAFFARKGADCLGKYVGDAERQLRLLFQVAAASAPSIIFFDEMDGLAPARAAAHADQTHASCVATLLSLLDGATPRGAVVVIAATNRPDAIDPALRRPGRFDREIFFPLPSLRDRAAILAVHTAAWAPAAPPAVLRAIAAATPGYAGADLAALAAQAALLALKRTVGSRVHAPPAQSAPLPPVHVAARDWAAALAAAPRPASRRSCLALLAAPPASPLPAPLVPLLGPPLAALLRALHSDGRVALPPAARTAADAVAAALENVCAPSARAPKDTRPRSAAASQGDAAVWNWASAAERASVEALQATGVVPRLGEQHPGRSDLWEDDELERPRFDGAGVRVLICGAGHVGQDAIAAALVGLLEGASSEAATASLGSLVLAGHGDLHHGLSSILADARARRASLLVMPRVESWACAAAAAPCVEQGAVRTAPSAAWKMFLQQMGATPPAAAPGLILATTGFPAALLPTSITSFFGNRPPPLPPTKPLEARPAEPRPKNTVAPEGFEGSTWRLRGGAPGGAVGCWQLELVPGDEPRVEAMLQWAAHSTAAELAHAYARQERGKRNPKENRSGHEEQETGRRSSEEDGPGRNEQGSGPQPVDDVPGPVSEREKSSVGDVSVSDKCPVNNIPVVETETNRQQASIVMTTEPAMPNPVEPPNDGTETAGAIEASPSLEPQPAAEPASAEDARRPSGSDAPHAAAYTPLAAALHWCGQQLLTSPQWAGLRRASAASGAEREARRRVIEPGQGASGSPAPAGAVAAGGVRDATPPRTEAVGGLIGVGHVACSDGFASAADLATAVGRVIVRVRRREEAERGRLRRAAAASAVDADPDGYSLLLASAAALQDTVAGWEYAIGRSCSGIGSGASQGTGLRGSLEPERPGEGVPGDNIEGERGMEVEGSPGEEHPAGERGKNSAGLGPGSEELREVDGANGDNVSVAPQNQSQVGGVAAMDIEPGVNSAPEQRQGTPGGEGRDESTGQEHIHDRGESGSAKNGPIDAQEATGEEQGSGEFVGGWAAECLQSVIVVVLQQYTRERDRARAPTMDVGARSREEKAGVAISARGGPGMSMETVLEVVAITNCRLQAASSRSHRRTESDACVSCREFIRELRNPSAGVICLAPLRSALGEA